MTEKIEKEIEVKAEQITSNLIAFMKELDTEANKQIKELEFDIEFYKKENAELKEKNEANENGAKKYAEFYFETNDQLTNAKEIIKDYMIIVKSGHITVCSVPEENRCINVLKLNEQAEQFLSEVEK